MRIAVTDANIFIDLIYLDIHLLFFKLTLEIYTTQNVLDELDDDQVEELSDLITNNKLILYQFSEPEMTEFSEYITGKGLSVADHSVLFIAKKMNAMIISGDALVRKTGERMNVEVHGILWILEEYIKAKLYTWKEAHEKLKALMLFNKRLPEKECEYMLTKWEENF